MFSVQRIQKICMTKTLIQLAKALHKRLGHQEREKQRKKIYVQVNICSAPKKECLQAPVDQFRLCHMSFIFSLEMLQRYTSSYKEAEFAGSDN